MDGRPKLASIRLISMTNVLKINILLLTAAVGVSACDGNSGEPSPADNTKDRGAILSHWADNIIIPSYENFQEVLALMSEKTDAFTSSPDEGSLVSLRAAWASAYLEWQKVELFEFGAADKYTLRNLYNIYPADVTGIITNINDPSANLDVAASYSRQGFPALDYLLNGIGDDDAAIVAAYTTDENAEKRIAYMKRLVTRMNTLLTNVITEWKGSYRETFISKTGLDIGSSTGLVVNAYVLYYERYIRSGKIGIPSGAAIGGTGEPHAERVEAFYKKDISGLLAKNAHEAARNFFNGINVKTGTPGPSFKSYLDALGAKDDSSEALLSDLINDQFDVISEKLDQLSPDYHQQIQTANEKMVDTYAEMQKLVRMLKVDMTSAMSVTITYTDNDGD